MNLACPGLHRTDRMLELYGEGSAPAVMGDPAYFGSAVTFLCSQQAGFITANHARDRRRRHPRPVS